jgi:hypothetical protein
MFNQILKNFNTSIESLPIISSIQQPSKQVALDTSIDIEKLVELILKLLSNSLSEKIGEIIDENEFKDVAADLVRSKALESHLI